MCTNSDHEGEKYIYVWRAISIPPPPFLCRFEALYIHTNYINHAQKINRKLSKSQIKMSAAVVKPLNFPQGSNIDFGAEISGVDVENLTGKKKAIEAI